MFFLKIIDDQDVELEITQKFYRAPIPEKLQWRNWAANPEGMTGEALLAFVNGEMFLDIGSSGFDTHRHLLVSAGRDP
jgi:type I restriction enzyme M protein